MGKVKKAIFSVTPEEFEAKWPSLEKALRAEMEAQGSPPGGGAAPAGGLSMNFDSLSAVIVVQGIIPDHLGVAPPAEQVIREGGYQSIDHFIKDIKPKLISLCSKAKTDADTESETN